MVDLLEISTSVPYRAGVRKAPTRSRRPQQRSEETREKLARAAVAVFAERGFAGATTRAIAEEAGVALAALPYHFETKEALWRAAAERLFAALERELGTRARGHAALPPRERLENLLADFVRFAARHPELHRFMLHEGGAGESQRLRWLVERHVRPLFRGLSVAIREAQALGLAPAGRPEHLFYAWIGAASMPYAVAPEFRLLTGSEPDDPARVEEHVAFLLRLFRGESPAQHPIRRTAGRRGTR
jgi:TetR/AcrR family transcriptional regulator